MPRPVWMARVSPRRSEAATALGASDALAPHRPPPFRAAKFATVTDCRYKRGLAGAQENAGVEAMSDCGHRPQPQLPVRNKRPYYLFNRPGDLAGGDGGGVACSWPRKARSWPSSGPKRWSSARWAVVSLARRR